jgi:hypothetical protein
MRGTLDNSAEVRGTSRDPSSHGRARPGSTRASRRNGGEISHEGLTDLVAASRLLDARLKAGQDALDHRRGFCLVMQGLDPCIPAKWRRDKSRRSDWIPSPDLASWMPDSRPGKTRWPPAKSVPLVGRVDAAARRGAAWAARLRLERSTSASPPVSRPLSRPAFHLERGIASAICETRYPSRSWARAARP